MKKYLLTLSFITLHLISYAEITFFVSTSGSDKNPGTQENPVRTIHKALQLIQSQNADDHILIFLRGGIYYIHNPIEITNETTKNFKSLTISAYQNEKVIISGGQEIRSWSRVDKHIYKSYVGNFVFRQLYIDNEKAIRAREPNLCDYYKLSWDKEKSKYFTNKQSVEKLKELIDAPNPVELYVQRIWATQIFRLSNIEKENDKSYFNILASDNRIGERGYLNKGEQSFHLENSYKFLDSDSEWYLDKQEQEVYIYLEDTTVDINKKNIIAPKLERLISINGETSDPAKNVTIEGITFQHTNWTFPYEKGLYVTQANILYDEGRQQPLNGGILVSNARNVKFRNNTIEYFGGNGLLYYSNVKNSEIKGNIVREVSSNGIIVDWHWIFGDTLSQQNCSKIKVHNNLITRIGTDYFSAVGIFVGLGDSIIIEHNHLYDLPYTGISVGIGHTHKRTNLRNNKIRYNYIDHAMALLSDGGAIYTLSSQPGTEISSNIIQNIVKSSWGGVYDAAGVYLDEGSNFISVTNNIFRNVDKVIQTNTERIGKDNIISKKVQQAIPTLSKAGLEHDYINNLKQIIRESHCDFYAFGFETTNTIELGFYPNPVDDMLYLSNYELFQANAVQYSIHSIQGKVIEKNIVNQFNLPFGIHVSHLPSGIYILNIAFNNYIGSGRFIKF